MSDDPKRIVERGYDAIADTFAAWQSGISDEVRLAYLDDLLPRLPERPDVLELGVGAGHESSRRLLAAGVRLVGVDISAEQLSRAAARLPGATLVHGDVCSLDLAGASFDAVVSFYSLNNLPQDELGPLLVRVHEWLRPGGFLLASLPSSDNPGWRGEWLGAEMFFAGHAPGTNRRLAEAAGLEVVRDELETMREPDGESRWHWLLARRGGQPSDERASR